MANFINKNILVDKESWDKLKEIAKEPSNRRDVGKQAGIIIEEYVDNYRTMKEVWKDLIHELDDTISHVQLNDKSKLEELYKKRELLEDAFNRV